MEAAFGALAARGLAADLVMWTSRIGAYARKKEYGRCLEIFEEMVDVGCYPDAGTAKVLLAVCSDERQVEQVTAVVRSMHKDAKTLFRPGPSAGERRASFSCSPGEPAAPPRLRSGQLASIIDPESYLGNTNLHNLSEGNHCFPIPGNAKEEEVGEASEDPILCIISAASFVFSFWASVAFLFCHPFGQLVVLKL